MTNLKPLELLSALTQDKNADSRLLVQTTYGLIVEGIADGAIDVRLSDSNGEAASSETTKPGYQYYFWPDYKTSFVWYKPDCAGNPGDETHVDEDVLKERYGEAWQKALVLWVDKYTQAFEAHEGHLGSRKEPFPDPDERAAWLWRVCCWRLGWRCNRVWMVLSFKMTGAHVFACWRRLGYPRRC
jgi:hypothetical protein